jgi:ferredoxin-NADP reductase
MWTALSIRRMVFDRRQFELQLTMLRRQVERIGQSDKRPSPGPWSGFRKFVVQDVVRETLDCVSLWLVPEDGRALPFYFPGQHLTVRLAIPGRSQPVVRCYTLSDSPHSDRYRITVRAIGQSAEQPGSAPGLASHFIHQNLRTGDRIDIKAPSGSFYLDLMDRRPLVMLAGGIGITPFISMLNTLVQQRIQREILLIYGVQNGDRHAFKSHLAEIARNFPLIDVVTCYSRPLPSDRQGADYQIAGRVSVGTIRKLVPSNQVPFYLCGPAEFMRDLLEGLREWGVPESCIHFEAFGPASIRNRKPADKPPTCGAATATATLTFQKSSQSTPHQAGGLSILELAEQADVNIASGCRAGNCGTCQVRLISGATAYIDDAAHAECAADHVLACVARPIGDVVVDA